MNYKKQNNKKTIWRKEVNPTALLHEWSRMLHLWWKKDAVAKRKFKKGQDDY